MLCIVASSDIGCSVPEQPDEPTDLINLLTNATDAAEEPKELFALDGREAAIEFARAAAVCPQLVGEAFGEIAKDQDVVGALLRVLEVKQLLETNGEITLIPGGESATLLRDLVAAKSS